MSPHIRSTSADRSTRRAGRRRTAAAVAVVAVLLAACTGSSSDDEVADWSMTEIEEEGDVRFLLPVPPGGATWRPGDSDGYAELAVTAAETEWWRFWAPRLEALTPETSNVRAMAAGGVEGELFAIQVNRSAYDLDVDPGDAAAIAAAFESIAIAQGSALTDTRTVPVEGFTVDEVAEVAFIVDPGLLGRDVWQRIIPVPERDELWSVQCDAPSSTDSSTNGGTDGGTDSGADGGTDSSADGSADGGTDGSADGGTASSADAAATCRAALDAFAFSS